jgi:excisionase family DNA binding protein
MNISPNRALNSREETPVPMPKKDISILPAPALSDMPEMLTTAQLASIFQLSENGIRDMLRRKKIRSIKVGQNYRVPKLWLLEDFFTSTDGDGQNEPI